MLRESKDAPAAISFTLNGKPTNHVVDPDRSLLKMLREDFDIISPKNGCEPQAQCGCCTVWNGRSCCRQMP